MSVFPYPSGTMLVPSGPGNHLFIVMTNRCPTGQHLLFSVSSVKPSVHFDAACEFFGGEHEFIKKHSYVYYRLAEQRRADSITKLVQARYFEVKADLSPSEFQRVCDGVETSKFVKPWAVSYFRQNRP
jgi:hypothetical protein